MAVIEAEKKTPYGFIIYRGDFSDDAQWERYMAYLKLITRWNLESEDIIEQWERMDWKVIASPELNNVEPETICDKFNEWLESGEEEINPNSYRYRACLYIDKGCLDGHDSFMEDKSLDQENRSNLFDIFGFTFGILVSRFEDEGWVYVSTSSLMPRAGQIIMHQGEYRGWTEVYREPGTISVDF